MKNGGNKLIGLLVVLLMSFTPGQLLLILAIDQKDRSGRETNKPVEIIMPKEKENGQNIDSHKKPKKLADKYNETNSFQPYDAGICRGHTYYSSTNVRRRQR